MKKSEKMNFIEILMELNRIGIEISLKKTNERSCKLRGSPSEKLKKFFPFSLCNLQLSATPWWRSFAGLLNQ